MSLLGAGEPWPAEVDELIRRAETSAEDVDAGLALAAEFGDRLPRPGGGSTLQRWEILAELGRRELTPTRILEAHTDALAILGEAGMPAEPGTWGVFAAESPGVRLDAEQDVDGWTVSGTKPWCSLGDRLDHALVTAHVGGDRQLFAVRLSAPGVHPERPDVWVARGLRTVTSGPVHFDRTPAVPIGEPGWYLRRSGFAWGGIGVAAAWFGAATGLRDRLRRQLDAHDGDPLLQMHLGSVDAGLHAARCTLEAAAAQIDSGRADGVAGVLLALRVRAVVADTVERTLRSTGHALGPAPLAFDAAYARRVADLEIYVRQHHGERDLAALGAELVARR